MARGLRETVDCERLALEGATIERVYALADLPRLKDLLADREGQLRVRFAFFRTETGRPGAIVEIESTAHLVCRRCLSGFPYEVAARSEIEFAADESAAAGEGREPYVLEEGTASLAELAEEEFLLAVPLAPYCGDPQRCGRASAIDAHGGEAAPDVVRPFGALRELLKKTDRT